MRVMPREATGGRASRVPTVGPGGLVDMVRQSLDVDGRMQMVYAWAPTPDGLELRYLASGRPGSPFIQWRCEVQGTVPSVAGVSPLMGWYEREVTDLFGIVFEGHPEPRRLVLHEGALASLPPLDPRYRPADRLRLEQTEAELPEAESPEIQRLPFGPVRADVVESAELIFLYIGEHILHFHPRLFFKHRGMEKRFQGQRPTQAVILAERVSAVGSVAHALAYCQALESAADIEVPRRARFLRVLLAELERLYNHLHYLGHLADTTTLKVGAAEGLLLEERAKQLNGRLTGSRFLRGMLTPGGLRRDLDPKPWLPEALEALRREIAAYTSRLEDTYSYLDRLITTGPLDRKVAFDQGATGPVERGSGLDRDLRRDHAYAAYGELPVTVAVRTAGDAHARAQVRVAEIETSIALAQRVMLLLQDGPIRVPCEPPPGTEGLGWAESPRGSLFYAVHVGRDGHLARVKIKSPSFSNWRVFPFTVHESNMMDYAINEASFGLTIAGCDR